MATKPITQPEYWATDAVYTTGPFVGQPQKVVPPGPTAAEGHRPGALFPTPAEYENSQQYNITGLCQWTFAGSSTGAADAHIVETDSAGRAGLQALTVIDAADETAVVIQGSATILPAVTIGNITGGSALAANTGNTAATCIAAQTGNSTGVGLGVVMAGTIAGGAGLNIFATVIATADAIVVDHNGPSGSAAVLTTDGTSSTLLVTATGTGAKAAEFEADDDAAIFAEGGVTSSAAILALGKVNAVGLRASGGPSGANGVEGVGTGSTFAGTYGVAAQYGAQGLATDTVDGFGVFGQSAVLATVQAGGVMGEGRNDGTGVFGVAADGYGGLFAASGSRPTVFLSSRGSDPTSTVTGGIWNRSTLGLSMFVANVARRIWHTAGGATIAWNSDFGGGTVDDTADIIVQCTASGANAPVGAGTVWILAVVEVGRNSGAPGPDMVIQVGSTTDGVFPISNTVQLFQASGASVFERHVFYIVPYPVTAGSHTFEVNIRSTIAGQDLNWRSAAMAVIGVF